MLIVYTTVPSVLFVLLAATALCYYHHAKSRKNTQISRVDVESDFSSGPQDTALQRFERDHLSNITMVNTDKKGGDAVMSEFKLADEMPPEERERVNDYFYHQMQSNSTIMGEMSRN